VDDWVTGELNDVREESTVKLFWNDDVEILMTDLFDVSRSYVDHSPPKASCFELAGA
jgi:hypothetical protein